MASSSRCVRELVAPRLWLTCATWLGVYLHSDMGECPCGPLASYAMMLK